VDAGGNAVFVWQGSEGGTDCGGFSCSRAEVRTRSAAGTLGAIQDISPAGESTYEDPQIAVNPNGIAAATWLILGGQGGVSKQIQAAVGP
jgi:hypothetical protein